jgi:hypothetical protein
LKVKQKLYLNAGIFLDSIKTIFLQYIDIFAVLEVFAEEVAALLMDNCAAHVSDDVIHIPTESKVRVMIVAPHPTQVFQVLDLTLFGVLKRCPRYELPFDDEDATVQSIMKVYLDFTQIMVPSNVWEAFLALGHEFDIRNKPYWL